MAIDETQVTTHKINAIPTYADTGYSRLTIYLDPTTWQQVQIDYFDLAGVLLKTKLSTRLKKFHERYWRAERIEMRNHQNGKRTILDVGGQFVNLSLYTDSRTGKPRRNLDESAFTRRALER